MKSLRKLKKSIAILLLLIAVCLSGCTGGAQLSSEKIDIVLPEPDAEIQSQFVGDFASPDQRNVTLFYPAESGPDFTAVTRGIAREADMSIVESALTELLSDSSANGIAFSQDAKLIDAEFSCGTVCVNLAIEASAWQNDQDYLQLCTAISNTLLGINGVKAVNILIGDSSASLCGLPIGCFTEQYESIGAVYAQMLSEADRFLQEGIGTIAKNALLYYPSFDHRYLLPEVHALTLTDEDYIAAIIDALIEEPDNDGCCFSVIPKSLELMDSDPEIRITDSGERIIEFNFTGTLPNYIVFSGLEPWQFYGSLVLSVCSFVPEIDAVRILSGGVPVESCIFGNDVLTFEDGIYRRSDFAPIIGSSAQMYFANSENRLSRLCVALSQSGASSARNILCSMIAAGSPAGEELFSVFPQGIEPGDILGVSVTDQIATVNLSGHFYAECQSLNEQQERCLIYAMINTLCELDHIGAVRFLIEGRSVDSLAQNIYLKTALMPDPGIVS